MSNDMVQVPRRVLEELVGYLEQAEGPIVSVPDNGEWSERMVRALQGELGRHPGARAVGDEVADKPGQLVSLAEVAERKKIKKQNISNDLNGMSWTCKRLFGSKRWPFRAVQTGQGMAYVMQPEIAKWWLGK